MAIKLTMPLISRLGLTIPGGWEVKVPEVQLADEDEVVYVQYYMREGYRREEALEKVRGAMQKLWVRAWLQGLKEAMAILAKDYQHIHGTLDGFDPERLQGAYIPGDNTGRRGRPMVTMALVKMGQQRTEEGT